MPADAYYADIAEAVSRASKDTTKVGAVLVGPSGEIRLTGYNGPPIGVLDTADRFERPRKYLFASHAEMNLIAFAARTGVQVDGCIVVVTHQPCSICTRLLIQAGVSAVLFGDGTTSIPEEDARAAQEMAAEAGMPMEKIIARDLACRR